MDNIIFLIMRRMRRPLLTLIVVYTIAILGLVIIPGQDADGNRWHMDFFHAFYFVSFMSTTIGFGEIPYEFTDGQRLWVTISLYGAVVSWIYALGTILSLLRDATFQQAIVERRFAQRIRHLREPFYLICGYGETGSALVRALTERGHHVVVIDSNEERISLIKLQNLREFVPSLHADARIPLHLIEAGLAHECCAGVVALTDQNESNLKIAITAKLLHPHIRVICRADSHDIEANLASFGTDYIIDPFDTFAVYLSVAMQTPGLYLLKRWLTGRPYSELEDPVYPPDHGRWIICGFGRFGKAIYQRLKKENIQVTVIEATPDVTGEPIEGCVVGRGTEAQTLKEAGIETAVGLVAGTDHDANNLSIVMTARELTPDLFVIARQNKVENQSIFDAIDANMVMHASAIIADKIRVLLATPLLYEFLSLAVYEEEEWACELISRVTGLVHTRVPVIMELSLDKTRYDALAQALKAGAAVTVGQIMRDTGKKDGYLNCIALLLKSRRATVLMPGHEAVLNPGDKLVFCGSAAAFSRMEWNLSDRSTFNYILTGREEVRGWFWKKYIRRNH